MRCYIDNEIKCYMRTCAIKDNFPNKRALENTRKKVITLNKYISTQKMARRKYIKTRTVVLLGWQVYIRFTFR